MTKAEYSYSIENPEKYELSKAITKDFDKYSNYSNKIKEIRNNTTNDKIETIRYINSLNLSIPQKALFIRQYYKSFNDYNNEIVEYVSNLNVSYEKKKQILEASGMTIDSKGNVRW